MDTLTNVFRTLMFFIDNAVYSIIPLMYQLLLYLAQIDIFSSEPGIRTLMNQIYTLLGIFMLFKLAFSFLQYIINPDNVTDKGKGVGKIITNTLVVVLLLVAVPYIFKFAANVQYAIIKSNVVGEFILGSSTDVGLEANDVSLQDIFNFDLEYSIANASEARANDDDTELESEAKDLQFLIYGAFFSVNTNVLTECKGTPIFSSVEMANHHDCLKQLETEFGEWNDIATNGVTLGSFFKGYENGQLIDNRRFVDFDKLLWWYLENPETGNNEYAINYIPFVSAAAGIYLIFLLVSFCIDIAVRAVKLCFLQIIAPISIVSYIDPNENAKESKLGKWASTCWKTYLSLFIRLAVIFLVIRFVSIIATGVFGDDGFASNIQANEYTMWIYIFLVLGAFTFAKQVPKMLENLLGFESAGELSLSPGKNITNSIADTPFLSTAVTGGIGAVAGGLAGLRAGGDVGSRLRGTAFGAISGFKQGKGAKLEPGLFNKARRGTYKEMTGNDLATFNPLQKMMAVGAESRIKDVGDPLKVARDQLNRANTQLGVLSHQTQESSNFLTSQHIDLNKLNEARTEAEMRRNKADNNLQTAENELNNSKSQLSSLESQLNQLRDSKVQLPPAAQQRRNADIANMEKQRGTLQAAIAEQEQRVARHSEERDKHARIVSEISNYQKAVKRENDLRSEMAKIQGNIDTLSKEKKQRQQFFGVDPAPKQSVKSAKEEVASRENSFTQNNDLGGLGSQGSGLGGQNDGLGGQNSGLGNRNNYRGG